MPVFVVVVMFFLKFNDENFVLVECGIEIKFIFFSYGHDSKVLEVIYNL